MVAPTEQTQGSLLSSVANRLRRSDRQPAPAGMLAASDHLTAAGMSHQCCSFVGSLFWVSFRVWYIPVRVRIFFLYISAVRYAIVTVMYVSYSFTTLIHVSRSCFTCSSVPLYIILHLFSETDTVSSFGCVLRLGGLQCSTYLIYLTVLDCLTHSTYKVPRQRATWTIILSARE